MKKHNSSNQIFVNKNNKKVISVQRINSSVFNSPITKKRILSESNTISYGCGNGANSFIYKKTKFVKPRSVYQSKKKMLNLNETTMQNSINKNTYSPNSEKSSIVFIPSKKDYEVNNNFNYIHNQKKIKEKKNYYPICQLYNMPEKNKEENLEYFSNRINQNNSYYYFNIKNENIINNNDTNSKLKLVNSSNSTALSFSDFNNMNKKNRVLNNNYISPFSVNSSFERIPFSYIYKKAVITPFDGYSYDDFQIKANSTSNKIINSNDNNNNDIYEANTININEDNPLVTFGNSVNDKNNFMNDQFPSQNNINKNNEIKINKNKKDNTYIYKLKRENEILKNELIKTNQKISLLENKIGTLISEKINKPNTNGIAKTKSFTYRKKNGINTKCPMPTPYVQKYSQRDIIPKENSIKVSLKQKDKIKPIIDRIFRNCNTNSRKNKCFFNNNYKQKEINQKNDKNYLLSSPNDIIKTKIKIKKNKNKIYQEYENQIENIMT